MTYAIAVTREFAQDCILRNCIEITGYPNLELMKHGATGRELAVIDTKTRAVLFASEDSHLIWGGVTFAEAYGNWYHSLPGKSGEPPF